MGVKGSSATITSKPSQGKKNKDQTSGVLYSQVKLPQGLANCNTLQNGMNTFGHDEPSLFNGSSPQLIPVNQEHCLTSNNQAYVLGSQRSYESGAEQHMVIGSKGLGDSEKM